MSSSRPPDKQSIMFGDNRSLHYSVRSLILIYLLLVVTTTLVIALNWIGFRNYIDGALSIRGAMQWLHHFPYLGTTHWELRHPYILAITGAISIFGLNELSVLIPSILSLLAIAAITLAFFIRYGHIYLGVICWLILLSIPVFVFAGSTIFSAILETLLILSSVLLFASSLPTQNHNWPQIFIAGLLGGLAYTTRETSSALAFCYLILFITGFGGRRKIYFILAAGFLLPILLDFLFIYTQSGDLFYRIKIDLRQFHPWKEMLHLDYIHTAMPAKLTTADLTARANSPDLQHLGSAGPIDMGHGLNPFIALFTNHEYQIIFLLAIPVVIMLSINPPQEQWLRRLLVILGTLSICWFITVTYVLQMRALPRYMLPVVYSAIIVISVYIYRLARTGRIAATITIAILLLACSIVSFDLENERLHEERKLVHVAATRNEPVHAAPQVIQMARFLIQTKDLQHRVTDSPPGSGDLYLYSAESLATVEPGSKYMYTPKSSWEILETHTPRTRILGAVLKKIGVLDSIPEPIRTKIYRPGPTLILYRVRK